MTTPDLPLKESSGFTVAEHIRKLRPYSPGRSHDEVAREYGITDPVKLASNENPFGPSPLAQEAMRRAASHMHLYPDASCQTLRCALSDRLAVPPEWLIFGNGSDDLIHLIGLALLEPGDEVVQADPTFVRYESAATLNRAVLRSVPLDGRWDYDVEAMLESIGPATRLVFISNPNNPTGGIMPAESLDRLLDRLPARALLVLDEAYFEYASAAPDYPDAVALLRSGRNIAALRTFSKAYGLAGLRVGYGIVRAEVANWLNGVREPFNVSAMAQAAAAAALEDTAFLARTLAATEAGKSRLFRALEGMGIECKPTWGNFVWVDTRQPAQEVFDRLLREGVIVRASASFRSATHLRVTIGTQAEVDRFLAALGKVLEIGVSAQNGIGVRQT